MAGVLQYTHTPADNSLLMRSGQLDDTNTHTHTLTLTRWYDGTRYNCDRTTVPDKVQRSARKLACSPVLVMEFNKCGRSTDFTALTLLHFTTVLS